MNLILFPVAAEATTCAPRSGGVRGGQIRAHPHAPPHLSLRHALSLSHPLPSAWRWDQAEELYY